MDQRAVDLRHQLAELEYKAKFSEMIALGEYHTYDINGDQRVEALIGLREAYYGAGDEARAEQYIAKAIALARKEASSEALCEALCSAATMNVQNAKYDTQMTRWAQEALTIAEAQNYARGVVLASVSLALGNALNGSRSGAHDDLLRVLKIAQKLPDRDDEARVWSALAQVSWWGGRPGKAVDYQRRGMALYFQNGNDVDRSIALINMAQYHFTNWRAFRAYEQAMVYVREGLALARMLKYRYCELGGLTTLGSFYLISQQGREAVETFEKVLDLARQHGLKRYEWQGLFNLGAAYMLLKDYDRALDCLQLQIALADAANYSRWDVYAHYQMGNVYQKQKRYRDALRLWQEALNLERQQPGKLQSRYYISQGLYWMYMPYYAVRMRLRV